MPSSIHCSTRRGSIPSNPRMTIFCLNFSGGALVPQAIGRSESQQDRPTARDVLFCIVFLDCGVSRKYSTRLRLALPRRAPRRVPFLRARHSRSTSAAGGSGSRSATRPASLARPLEVIEAQRPGAARRGSSRRSRRLAAEDDGLGAVVVGLPRRLDGTPNEQTPVVQAFAEALRARIAQPIVLQDERLSSVEAESRLARPRPRLAQPQEEARRGGGGGDPAGLPGCEAGVRSRESGIRG